MLKSLSAGAAAVLLIAGTSLVQAQDTTERQKTVIQNPDGSQAHRETSTDSHHDDD